MDVIQAVVLGVVEGITEFLPISSTAHLIITSKLMRIKQTEFVKLFEVVIQTGGILAVIFLYAGYLARHRDVIVKVLISFIPTAVAGLFLHKVIKEVFFETTVLMIAAFFLIGLAFLIIEFLIDKEIHAVHRSLHELTYLEAVAVGVAQSFAIIPGVSRAGIVLISMMVMRYKRADSAIYSFLLAIPTIFAASVFDMYKSKSALISSSGNILLLSMGFASAAAAAFVSVRWLLEFLKNHSLVPFGIYRIFLAIILLAASVF